jgi:hypothetical protein
MTIEQLTVVINALDVAFLATEVESERIAIYLARNEAADKIFNHPSKLAAL